MIHYYSCSVSLSNNIQNASSAAHALASSAHALARSSTPIHKARQQVAIRNRLQLPHNWDNPEYQSGSSVHVFPAFLHQAIDVCRSDPPIYPRYVLSERYAARCCPGSVLPLKCLNFKALWPKRWNECATATWTAIFLGKAIKKQTF